MKYKTHSPDYETKHLSWPKWLPKKCPSCEAKVVFKNADNGKLVHCLDGIINQVRNHYACTNSKCVLYGKGFNPCPRFDYGERRYGADVFRWIAEKLLLWPTPIATIHKELSEKYVVQICLRTVQRICDDIHQVKAKEIDATTAAILKKSPFVVIGLDGQEPKKGGKALWLFLDLLHGRVLYTCVVETINYEILHEIIELIRNKYDFTIQGFVSDKQGLITTCMETYYPDIPHQYCLFHFLNNQWKHLTSYDSNVYLPLKKTADHLYIHTANATLTVNFEGVGRESVRKAFKSIDQDIQAMIRVSNKALKRLRGITLYIDLTDYVGKLHMVLLKLDPTHRFTKILNSTVEKLTVALEEVSPIFEQSTLIFGLFQKIRQALKDPTAPWVTQYMELENIYKEIWELALAQGLNKSLAKLRTFPARKTRSFPEILGELCRLWHSYQPGLFRYVEFSSDLRTNIECERGFSKEKQALFRRTSKKEVNHLIETRGEEYLRLCYCEREELQSDIVQEYTLQNMRELREELQKKITGSTSRWYRSDREYNGFEAAILEFYGGEMIKNPSEEDD